MKKHLPIVFVFAIISCSINAQVKKDTASLKAAAKIKKPIFKTYLSNFSDSLTISTDQAKKIIDNPLIVLDDNKIPYQIISYGLIYKKLGYNIDPKTGKDLKIFTYAYNQYTTTPIPEKWRKLINEVIVPEEELTFTEIYVKDKQGKIYLAPNLKIILK